MQALLLWKIAICSIMSALYGEVFSEGTEGFPACKTNSGGEGEDEESRSAGRKAEDHQEKEDDESHKDDTICCQVHLPVTPYPIKLRIWAKPRADAKSWIIDVSNDNGDVVLRIRHDYSTAETTFCTVVAGEESQLEHEIFTTLQLMGQHFDIEFYSSYKYFQIYINYEVPYFYKKRLEIAGERFALTFHYSAEMLDISCELAY